MNKKKIFVPFALLGAFLLAGCSSTTIVAKPDKWDETKFIDKDVKDNNLLKIYTAIKELSDTNSNVLNNILFKIATSIYGEWNNVYEYGSKEFSAVKGDENFKKFVEEHKEAYATTLTKKYEGEVESDLTDEEKLQIAHNNIKNVYEQVKEESYKTLYNELTGGSYSTDNEFYEERYVTNNLYKNMYIDYDTLSKARNNEFGELLEKVELPLKSPSETYENYLKTYFDTLKSTAKPDDNKLYGEYFSRKLIKDVYRTLLVQNYVKTQRFSTLGRTYARKVNLISVPNGGTTYTDKVGKLFKNFVTKSILNTPTEKYDFSLIEKAMRGIVGTDKEGEIYSMLTNKEETNPGFEVITVKDSEGKIEEPLVWNYLAEYIKDGQIVKAVTPTHVFKGTKLGDLVEKYLKVYDVTYKKDNNDGHKGNFTATLKSTIDESAFNDLTGTNSYDIEHGLTLKEREINKVSYVKNGWYLKSGTISELTSDYKERLFSIDVSLQLDDFSRTALSTDYIKYYDYKEGTDTKKQAFLTFKSISTESEENHIIINDGTNYVICEVEEAVSTSKLSESDKRSYIKAGDGVNSIIRYNNIVNKVVIESSAGDTYKKNANQFYIMLSNIVISDQSLYDYFKSQFPDLFNN